MDLFYKGKRVRVGKHQEKRISPSNKKDLFSFKNFVYLSMILGLIFFVVNKNSKQSNYNDTVSSSIELNLDKEDMNKIVMPISESLIDNVNEFVQELNREDMFIGDSRMKGMLNSGSIDEEHAVYGVGYGYSWFVGDGTFNSKKTNAVEGALNELFVKMDDDKRYNIIIWLGVNDYRYHTANVYFEEFVNLALGELSDQDLYIVSVGPVDDKRATTVNNEQINNFNENMKRLIEEIDLDNLNYIDLEFDQSSINRYDSAGLHYGSKDYENIYSIIEENINEPTKTLNLR